MIGNSYKIVIFLSIVFLLAILVRCDKPQESSSPPAIIKKVMQPVVTNTPVRKELSEEKPETNWFAAIDGTHGRLAGIFREANGNPITNVTATYHK